MRSTGIDWSTACQPEVRAELNKRTKVTINPNIKVIFMYIYNVIMSTFGLNLNW